MTTLVKATIVYYVEDEEDVPGFIIDVTKACTRAARTAQGHGGVVFQKPRKVLPLPPEINARGGVA